jgi:hypothetical protein
MMKITVDLLDLKWKKGTKKSLTTKEIPKKVQIRLKKINLMRKKCRIFKNHWLSQSLRVARLDRNSIIALIVLLVSKTEMRRLIKLWRRSQTFSKMKSPAQIMIVMKTFTLNLIKINQERWKKDWSVKIWQIIWS